MSFALPPLGEITRNLAVAPSVGIAQQVWIGPIVPETWSPFFRHEGLRRFRPRAAAPPVIQRLLLDAEDGVDEHARIF